jgi:2-iminobutanoate/2-iminopropanoate deaminase
MDVNGRRAGDGAGESDMAKRAKRRGAVKRAARPKRPARPHRQEMRVPGMSEPISHFTHVVRAGNIVFVSGCVASDDQGRTVGGADATAQARQALENIKRCLTAAGATFADVCKVTVFLKNMADREKVNVARKEYFGPHRPASTLVEISRFVRDDILVEIEATAVVAK